MKLHSILTLLAITLWWIPSSAWCQTAGNNVNITNNKAGGIAVQLAAKKVNAAYKVAADDYLVAVDTTAAAITITLPSAEHGRTLVVQNVGATGYAVTIDPPGTTTINGSSTYTLRGSNEAVTLQCYSVNSTVAWYATGVQNTERTQAVTATTTGATTGTILPGITFVSVTTDSSSKKVILPAPVVGTRIILHNTTSTAYKLQTSAPASIGINGGLGSTAASTIPADSTCVLYCVTATSWKGFYMDADSDVAKVPAAL